MPPENPPTQPSPPTPPSSPPRDDGSRKHVRSWQAHNRRRWELEKDLLAVDERAPFVCECTSGACLQPVELTMFEFEAAHMVPTWCATIPGHVVEEDGSRPLVQHPHFWIVELYPIANGAPPTR
jgi:hypothetical protein